MKDPARKASRAGRLTVRRQRSLATGTSPPRSSAWGWPGGRRDFPPRTSEPESGSRSLEFVCRAASAVWENCVITWYEIYCNSDTFFPSKIKYNTWYSLGTMYESEETFWLCMLSLRNGKSALSRNFPCHNGKMYATDVADSLDLLLLVLPL